MPPSLPSAAPPVTPVTPVTRRLTVGAALAAPWVRPAAAAAPELHITAYDGFVPPALQQRFERETGTAIRIRPVASQAPELTLLTAERDHPSTDICTVAGSRLHQFTTSGIIAPVDTARLRNWSRIAPAYADAPWNRVAGQVAGVPLLLGANVLVSHTATVRPAPDSWAAMFDPRWRGRTTCNIEDFLLATMLLHNDDPTFLSYLAMPEAARAAVNRARDRMIASKPQIVRYFDDGAELQALLLGGDALLAQTYSGIPGRLMAAGQPFRRTVPREGSMGFVYAFAPVRNAPNPGAAYLFLDMLLGTPGIGALLTRASGYASTFTGGAAGLSPGEQEAFGIPEDAAERLLFPRFEGQALSSTLIDGAVEEVRAG